MGFLRQFRALVWKNLLSSILRHPLRFLLKFYAIPLILFSVLVLLPSWVSPYADFTTEQPAPIRALRDASLPGTLAIVRPSNTAADIAAAIKTFTEPLDQSKIAYLDTEADLLQKCPVDEDKKNGACDAAIIFHDSPETKAQPNATWSYTIRAGGGMGTKHSGSLETVYMPLQLALHRAITNDSASPTPQTFVFAKEPEQQKLDLRTTTIEIATKTYLFIIFACHLFTAYQLTSWVTRDRESGASALVDSMGGPWAPLSRTLSLVIVMDLICLPLFIIFGIVYHALLFPTSSVAGLIGWQILQGMAINSSAAFGASFFKQARVSSIIVTFLFLLLAIATQFYITRQESAKADPSIIKVLSSLFPSCSYALFMFDMGQWEKSRTAADFSKLPPGFNGSLSDLYVVTQSFVLLALFLQALVYLTATFVIEWLFHGIHFKGRHFSGKAAWDDKQVAISTTGLRKKFHPGICTRVCCCGRRKANVAVDDVGFRAYQGQIVCLVGPNGSGKTTTLQMMGGFAGIDAGRVDFSAPSSSIGICPQRDILWEDLTVREHVTLWSGIKNSADTTEQIEQIIADCDLAHKRNSTAGSLSGGQKRKLQLACMLIGGSSVCLVDECTSGVDPLSRRSIWDLLLRNRTGRCIMLTTHFLDEVDVLANHIVLLAQGKVICQGSPAELNSRYGGGYKVVVERTPKAMLVSATLGGQPPTNWQDRLVYQVADCSAATNLSAVFAEAGVEDVAISGPQFEDVFLNLVAEADGAPPGIGTPRAETERTQLLDSRLTQGRKTSFAAQVRILLAKRFKVLPRVWSPYLALMFIVLAANLGILSAMTSAKLPECSRNVATLPVANTPNFFVSDSCADGGCDQLALAPQSAADTLEKLDKLGFKDVEAVRPERWKDFVQPFDGKDKWMEYIQAHKDLGHAGIYMGGSGESSLIAYQPAQSAGAAGSWGFKLLNVWSQMQSGTQINADFGGLPSIAKSDDPSSTIFVIFLTLFHAVYPAFFVVYPAIEQHSKTRSFQYANGVRRGPLVVAYMLFDLIWVAIVSTISTLVLLAPEGWIGSPWIMLIVLILHGICGTLISHAVGHQFNGPLRAFLAVFCINLVMFSLAAGVFLGTLGGTDASIKGITFGVGLFLPIGNVARAFIVGFNVDGQGCNGSRNKAAGAINSFLGPIIYLFLQACVIGLLSVWMDGGFSSLPFFKRKAKPAPLALEMHARSLGEAGDDVAAEVRRVEQKSSDLLRLVHVSKAFANNVAVDDVSFGLPQGEVLALLGPNGAGKSTLVNMIQSELSSDRGEIFLCGKNAKLPSSRMHLGVCPQHDSIDLLTTRQHLMFYARIKGVDNAKANVECLMERLSLAPHAKTMAARLSGGNKRKLALAIALMGMPRVLVLDEPTTAMDAMAKRFFWNIVESIAHDQAILLTTHSMEEADRLATRTAVMATRMLAIGTTAQLRRRHGDGYTVSLTLRSAPDSTQQEMQEVMSSLQSGSRARIIVREMLRGQIRFSLAATADGKPQHSDIMAMWNLLEQGKEMLEIEFFSIGASSLGDAFMNIVRANNVREENSENHEKTSLQRFLSLL